MKSSLNNHSGSNSKAFGGSGRGSKHQQHQNQALSSSSHRVQNQQQSKPNAWNKPLQATARNLSAAPPGLGPAVRSTDDSASVARLPTSNDAQLSSSIGNRGGLGGNNSSNGTAIHQSAFLTEIALRERFIHLVTNLTGQKVTITLKSGTVLTGILHTATPFPHLPLDQRNKYVLKAVSVEFDGSPSLMVEPGQTMIFDMGEVVQLHVKSFRMDQLVGSNSSGSVGDSFVTDTEISKTSYGKSSGPRDLVQAGSAWTSGGKDILLDSGSSNVNSKPYSRSSSADDLPINSRASKLAGPSLLANNAVAPGGALKGSIAGWDQFKANEELFNVTGSYDETVYTTPLDKSSLEADKIARAEKLAKEIESTVSYNPHLAEERGQVAQTDFGEELDEEDKYSGVLSSSRVYGIPAQSSGIPVDNGSSGDNKSEIKFVKPSPESQQPAVSSKPKLNYAAAAKQSNQTSVPPPGFVTDKPVPPKAPAKKEVQSLELPSLTKKPAPSKPEEPLVVETPTLSTSADTSPVDSKCEIVDDKSSMQLNDNATTVEVQQNILTLPVDLNDVANEELEDKDSIADIVNVDAIVKDDKEEFEKIESHDNVPCHNENKEQEDDLTSAAATSKSKLNANAKEFTLNVSAKPFTPPSTLMAPLSQSQQTPAPPMTMTPQHLQHHPHQFQPQYIDQHTGIPITMHAAPPFGAAGAHLQPHHAPIGGAHHLMGSHHMMSVAQAHHFPGQYPVIRGYPGQFIDPLAMQQAQPVHTVPQGPPPPPPPTASNSAPTTASTVTSTHTSGATTPVVSEESGEPQTAQPQEGNEPQPSPPLPPSQQVGHMQWQQQPSYYGVPMHVQLQQPHPRLGVPGAYPPQQFLHPSQIPALQMRQHHLYAPMVAGVAPPPQMRGNGGGPNVAAGVMPFIPGPHGHVAGHFHPFNSHNSGGPGVIVPAAGTGPVATGYHNGAVDDDGQGGYVTRGGRGGGRTGRGRGRGRGGRGRSGGRFNNQPYQSHNQTNVIGNSQAGWNSDRSNPSDGEAPRNSVDATVGNNNGRDGDDLNAEVYPVESSSADGVQ